RADRVLGGLEAEVLAQVALAVGLDLVLHQEDALGLERLEFLGQHAIITRPHVDGRGSRSGGAEDPFSGERHATLGPLRESSSLVQIDPFFSSRSISLSILRSID